MSELDVIRAIGMTATTDNEVESSRAAGFTLRPEAVAADISQQTSQNRRLAIAFFVLLGNMVQVSGFPSIYPTVSAWSRSPFLIARR